MSKTKGQQLEIYVADRLREILNCQSIRPTKASSGGSHNTEMGDILCSKFYIECKAWTTKNISFSLDVWNKLYQLTPLGSDKIPLYIIEHPTKQRFVLLTLEDFFRILEKK